MGYGPRADIIRTWEKRSRWRRAGTVIPRAFLALLNSSRGKKLEYVGLGNLVEESLSTYGERVLDNGPAVIDPLEQPPPRRQRMELRISK